MKKQKKLKGQVRKNGKAGLIGSYQRRHLTHDCQLRALRPKIICDGGSLADLFFYLTSYATVPERERETGMVWRLIDNIPEFNINLLLVNEI